MFESPFRALQAGKFVSRGRGRHVARVIPTWELIFVASGTLDMCEEDMSYHLGAGDYLLLEAGKRHGGIANYPADLTFFWVHFVPVNETGRAFLKTAPRTGHVFDRGRMAEYLGLHLALADEMPVNRTAFELVLRLVLSEVFRKPPEQDETERPIAPLAREAQRIIALQFYRPLSISSVASQLHCNADHLGRLFRQSYAMTFTEALHRRRMARVREDLAMSPLSIKEIAVRAGYEDMVYFRRRFFAVFAMTPREYRLKHAPGHANTE